MRARSCMHTADKPLSPSHKCILFQSLEEKDSVTQASLDLHTNESGPMLQPKARRTRNSNLLPENMAKRLLRPLDKRLIAAPKITRDSVLRSGRIGKGAPLEKAGGMRPKNASVDRLHTRRWVARLWRRVLKIEHWNCCPVAAHDSAPSDAGGVSLNAAAH